MDMIAIIWSGFLSDQRTLSTKVGGLTSLPECWDTHPRAGTNEGTSTFNRSLSSHTSTVAMSLFRPYIRAIHKHLVVLSFKNYVTVTVSAQKLQAVFFSYLTVLLCYSTT
jgi:hypothetical protein